MYAYNFLFNQYICIFEPGGGGQLGLRGGIKAQYSAFLAKRFPFYGYGDAIRPAGAA